MLHFTSSSACKYYIIPYNMWIGMNTFCFSCAGLKWLKVKRLSSDRTNTYDIMTVWHSAEAVFVFRCISKHTASMLASGSSWMPFYSLSHGKYVPVDSLVDKHKTRMCSVASAQFNMHQLHFSSALTQVPSKTFWTAEGSNTL